ncbi:MAG: asparagine synthase (glutamine-hydrolyzing) [Bacteroidetes bacterium]|nr:asparagine synthase (glutamine-hydrolyzing) [Bacteroidota bacterium]
MCGIAGLVYSNSNRQVDPTLLERMCAAIYDRGPDDQGFHIDDNVGLGMRRLSIIDLQTGHQPIYNEDGTVVVVFNGEIYNFLELRQLLLRRGHKFKTSTDTEVIVHLYEDYGESCVDKLRGMFAFALWDIRNQKLLLARDRLGVKPLFYRVDSERIIFGSEIKSILQDKSIPRSVDLSGIDQMMSYGYLVPPTTCFQGIHELPQASILIYKDGQTSIKRYWDLNFEVCESYDEEISCEQLLELLHESVRLRMISDVPLGALLSGGIDSALIVALMSQISDEPVKTFSIGFGDSTFTELPYAKEISELYKTDHYEFVIKPEVIEILPKLIQHHDMPFYDSSAIPTYYVCKMAREHVTVVLSGDGGDELFAGYNLYRADKAAGYYQKFPRWLRNYVISPLAKMVPESTQYINKGRVLREFIRAASFDPEKRYTRWVSKVKEEMRYRLYDAPQLVKTLNNDSDQHIIDLFHRQPKATHLNRMLYVDINTELAGDVLVKVDRMSMASSLEVRSPLLDHNLYEFAAKLPDQAKLKGFTTKYLLKKLSKKFLPKNYLKRPKRGFSVPLDRWFREELADYVREILFEPVTRTRGYFNQDVVEQLVENHIKGPIGYGREIWMLLTIELWHRMYIDQFEYAVVKDHKRTANYSTN